MAGLNIHIRLETLLDCCHNTSIRLRCPHETSLFFKMKMRLSGILLLLLLSNKNILWICNHDVLTC